MQEIWNFTMHFWATCKNFCTVLVLKKPSLELNFLYNSANSWWRRLEKCCQMLKRLFVVSHRSRNILLCWICYQNTHKYKFREITMAHQNLDTFKSVISQVVPIGVLNQLQITKLIVSAPLCFPQIWENWRVVDQSLWHFKLHCISIN